MSVNTEKNHVQRCTYLENKNLRADLPKAKLPGEQYVRHIVPHAVDEEEVPSLEALAVDCHLTKPASRPSPREENRRRGFRFDKYVRSHLDARSEFPSDMAKKPIF
jgi:hypothetical protein